MQIGLLAGACLLLAAIVIGTWLTLRLEYRTEVDDVLGQAEQAAQKLASRTAEVFDQVNQTTLLIKMLSERGDSFSLAALEDAGVLSRKLTRSVLVTDAHGHVLDTTSEKVALNIADENDFKQLRKVPDLDLVIGLPARNPLTGQWSIPLSRRVVDAHGAFAGVVSAAIDPAMLSSNYGRSEAPDTAVGVLGRDGIYRARSVGGNIRFGDVINIPALERRAIQIRETRNPLESQVDGIPRFIVRVDVDRYPFMAVVAVKAASALAGYERARALVLEWAAALAALVVGAAAGLFVLAGRLEKSRAATARSEQAFRATIEGCLDAVTILQAERDKAGKLTDLVVLDANGRAAELFGKPRGDVIGRRLCELAPSVRTDGFFPHIASALESGRALSSEVRVSAPSRAAGLWLHHQVVPLNDGVALITRDVTEKREAEQALAKMARFDPLTQLSNRRHFEEALESARARTLRSGDALALLYIDLDGFKKVNDEFGHQGGDLLLIEVARRLLGCVRSIDIVSRLGGDEFTVILEAAGNQSQILDVCDRILASLSAEHLIDGHVARVTPSIGAVVLAGAESCEAMRGRADEAMYSAKRAGKARHCLVFDPTPGNAGAIAA